MVAVEIWPDGKPHNFRHVVRLPLGLDRQAVVALRNWRFDPGTKNGKPVKVLVTIELNYALRHR